jgi:hypothetical protein
MVYMSSWYLNYIKRYFIDIYNESYTKKKILLVLLQKVERKKRKKNFFFRNYAIGLCVIKNTWISSGPNKRDNKISSFFFLYFSYSMVHVNNKQQYERIPSLGENSSIQQLNVNTEEKTTLFVYYLVFCVCIGGFR